MGLYPTLIETMRVEQGQIALLSLHLQRLHDAAQQLNYCFCPHRIHDAIQTHIKSLVTGTWRVRLSLDASGHAILEHSLLESNVLPVSLMLADTPLPASKWLQIKSSHRPWYHAAQQRLQEQPDVFDLIFSNQAGELCEGSRSNIYLQRDGLWLTPPVQCGLLPGVLRTQLLQCGLVREAVLYPADLQQAQAIRVSNALRGWLDAKLVS